MKISKGLYEVITSDRLTKEEKLEIVPRFSWPIHHLDDKGKQILVEGGELTKEQTEMICEAIKKGTVRELDLDNA
jgi:hypothetical protein